MDLSGVPSQEACFCSMEGATMRSWTVASRAAQSTVMKRLWRDGKLAHRYLSGVEHPLWKGDDATDEVKRKRARRWFPAGSCSSCGASNGERHHGDGNPGNNTASNIHILCRRCHMAVDGRLEAFRRNAAHTRVVPPKLCINCGRLSKPTWHGQCHACDVYQRRRGVRRPCA